MTALLRIVCAAALLLTAAACGATAKQVPDVTGDRLDVAQSRLDEAGLGYEVVGGGVLGVVVRSHWQVCEQDPPPGGRAKSVELVVERTCSERQPAAGTPDVTGLRLDAAERLLGARRLEYYVSSEDDVIIPSNWTVCDQYPEPGEPAAEVELYVDHFSCEDDE